MSKQIRILTAILASLMIGGMFAYQDAQKNAPTYQQHPTTVILTNFFCGSLVGLIFYFGSGWLERRKEKKLKQPGDDKFYDEVARELQDKPMSPGLWTKAFAETGGDDAKARALYIKYRVAQLAEASRQQFEDDRLTKQRQEQQKSAAIEADKRKNRTRLHRFCHTILWLIFILLTIGFCLGGLCLIVVPFTENFESADLIAAIGGAIGLFGMAFICGIGTKHCYKEME
jgi:hypothetical protein